jgi:hypothetical protein
LRRSVEAMLSVEAHRQILSRSDSSKRVSINDQRLC